MIRSIQAFTAFFLFVPEGYSKSLNYIHPDHFGQNILVDQFLITREFRKDFSLV